MTETMRAVITDGAGGLVLVDRPAPTPPVDGGLVRVLACGLCGSDLEKLDGGIRGGVVLGHEVVGVLERPGEEPVRVALAHHVPCGRCEACLRGHSSLCDQFVRTGLDPGGFAEQLAVSPLHLADAVFPLPDSVDDLTGTLLEPLSCVLRAVDVAVGASTLFPAPRVKGVRTPALVSADAPDAQAALGAPAPGVLVAGCGSVGLLFLSVLAVTQPASSLFYRERDAGRAALAEDLGARAAGSDEMQAAFVTAPAALSEVVELMAPGGVVVVFAAGAESTVPLDLGLVYRRELTLVGVRSGSPGHLRRALDLLAGGRLRLDWLRPDVVSLEGLPEAVDRYRRRETHKVVVRP